MNILIIGLGSMGKRRIRLLKKHFYPDLICGVDSNQNRCENCNKEWNIKIYYTLEEALRTESFDVAFICTPPLSHSKIISECLSQKINVFSEINLVSDGYFDNIALAKKENVKLFISSTLIYRDEIKYIHKRINNNSVCYTYHVGQYLKDWHPWENYKSYFIGDKRTSGCREILGIELPWLIKTFGEIKKIDIQKFKLTSLDIDYDDCLMMLIEHNNGSHGSFVVDVVAREPIRTLKIINEDIYLEWDGTPESLRVKCKAQTEPQKILLYDNIEQLESYNKTIVENEYVNEIHQFFLELKGEAESIYNFEDDLNTLSIIERIEK